MDRFLSLTSDDRRAYCEQADEKLSLSAPSIEKDFWVCWILKKLFSLPDIGPQLTFKGGTSLSKGWGLIKRFSEDIDVVIDRHYLGFAGDSAPEKAPGKKERNRRIEKLKAAAQELIRASLMPLLEQCLRANLPASLRWCLTADQDDPDQQTVLFEYASAFPTPSYVRPMVRIELGARSDTEPTGTPNIEPYLAQAFPAAFGPSAFSLRTVLPKRTFWEKAMLLHEETYRAAAGKPKQRLARHYYDLWCLIQNNVGAEAMADLDLFARVAAHRAVFFRKSKESQESLLPGSLRLLPLAEHSTVWRQDYRSMREMFFADAPDFDEILRVVGQFEREFNKTAQLTQAR